MKTFTFRTAIAAVALVTIFGVLRPVGETANTVTAFRAPVTITAPSALAHDTNARMETRYQGMTQAEWIARYNEWAIAENARNEKRWSQPTPRPTWYNGPGNPMPPREPWDPAVLAGLPTPRPSYTAPRGAYPGDYVYPSTPSR